MTFPHEGSSSEEEPESQDLTRSEQPASTLEVEEAQVVHTNGSADTNGWSYSDDTQDGHLPLSDEYDAEGWPEDPAQRQGQAMKRAGRVGWELVQTLVLAILIFLAVRAMAQNFRVEGSSMEPGLHNGQYLLVNKAVYFKIDLTTLSKFLPFVHAGPHDERFVFHGPQRGDVIVFRYPQDPSRDFIKRVIGLPGDTVQIVNGTVYVDGTALDEPYINGVSHANYDQTVIPAGNYFVLGDNRNNSSDSRSWGFVPEGNIIGKAMFTYWPLSDLGGVGNRHFNIGFIKVPIP